MIPPGLLAFDIYKRLIAYLNNEEGLRPLLEAVYAARDASPPGVYPALDDLLGSMLLFWAERTEYPGYEISEAQFRAELSGLIQTVWIGERPPVETGSSATTREAGLAI